MTQKIRKVAEEIERTKAKIEELQALMPELERKKADMENNEIIRLVRSANIAPEDFAHFIGAYRTEGAAPPNSAPAARQEVTDDDEE